MAEQAESGSFLDYLLGAGRVVGDAYVSDYLAERFPQQTVVEVPPGAAVSDVPVQDGPTADDVADKQFKLVLLAGAGVLSLVLLVSVLRR
jgi:hypothetical protein